VVLAEGLGYYDDGEEHFYEDGEQNKATAAERGSFNTKHTTSRDLA
jgi:hypothetical protein